MKTERRVAAAVLSGAVLIGSSAQADSLIGLVKSQSLSDSEVLLNCEQLQALGIDTRIFIDDAGNVRSLVPNELVKVEIHEEMGVIDFSSFDDFSFSISEPAALAPRNIGEHGN
jgi:hypothetical protein